MPGQAGQGKEVKVKKIDDEAVAAILKRRGLMRRGRKIDAAVLTLAMAGWLVLVLFMLTGCASTAERSGSYSSFDSKPGAAPASAAESLLGIRIAGIRLSAAGYMLDFRYHVDDPEKAAPLLDSKVTPYLLDEASGARLMVPDTPKLGSLRPTARNRSIHRSDYYMLFANPGRFLKSGSRVALVLGDVKIEHLTVQ